MDKVIEQISIYGASKTKHAPIWLEFRKSGYNIISTWIDEYQQGESESLRDLAIRCIEEPMKADVTILYVEPEDHIKFALAEVGAALGAGKPVIIVGNCKCLSETMLQHPNIRKVNTFLLAMSLLREIAAQKMNAPTTPATSWEEVEKQAEQYAISELEEKAVPVDHIIYQSEKYKYVLDYLSRHWPVSPTPMSETWEEVLNDIDQRVKEKVSDLQAGAERYTKRLELKVGMLEDYIRLNHATPSLHQVDRWGLESIINKLDEKVEQSTRLLETARNERDKISIAGYTVQISAYNDCKNLLMSLPAAPETDKTT